MELLYLYSKASWIVFYILFSCFSFSSVFLKGFSTFYCLFSCLRPFFSQYASHISSHIFLFGFFFVLFCFVLMPTKTSSFERNEPVIFLNYNISNTWFS